MEKNENYLPNGLKKLNNAEINIDPHKRTRIYEIDMNVYRFLIGLPQKTSASSKAKELFRSIVLSKPPEVIFGKKGQFQNKELSEYIQHQCCDVIKELFDIWYSAGFCGIKLYYEKNKKYPIVKILYPKDGIYMIVDSPDVGQEKLIFQWKDPVESMRATQINIVEYDEDVIMFTPHKPRIRCENTMEYVDVINNFMLGCEENNKCGLNTMIDWSTAFTSPWITILVSYFEQMRLSESQLRIEEQKLNQKLYIENEINFSDPQFTNYLGAYNGTETKSNLLNDLHVKRFLLGYPQKKVSVDPRIGNLPQTDITKIWQSHDVTPSNQTHNKQQFSETLIRGVGNDNDFDRAFKNSLLNSTLFGPPIYVSGQKAVVGSATQRFKFAPVPQSKTESSMFKQLFINEINDMYALPKQVIIKNKTSKIGVEQQDKLEVNRRMKSIKMDCEKLLQDVLTVIMSEYKTDKEMEIRESFGEERASFFKKDFVVQVNLKTQYDFDVENVVNLMEKVEFPEEIEKELYRGILDSTGLDYLKDIDFLVKKKSKKENENIKDGNKSKDKNGESNKKREKEDNIDEIKNKKKVKND